MKLKQALCSFILHRLMGWTEDIRITIPDKCVICVAPHTSNFDLFIGKLLYGSLGRKSMFLMKKEWFRFPLGIFFKAMGGIPVDRSRKGNLVEQLVGLFNKARQLNLAITPEGTRRANGEWKHGFYYIAQGAGVPIILGALDYKRRTVVIERQLMPTEDYESMLADIKRYYARFTPRHPERFAPDILKSDSL